MKNMYIDVYNRLYTDLQEKTYIQRTLCELNYNDSYTTIVPKKKLFDKKKIYPKIKINPNILDEIDKILKSLSNKYLFQRFDLAIEYVNQYIEFLNYISSFCLYKTDNIDFGIRMDKDDINYIEFMYNDNIIRIDIQRSKIKKINNGNVALSLISKEESNVIFYTISTRNAYKNSDKELFKFISNEEIDLNSEESMLLNLIFDKMNKVIINSFIDILKFCIKSHINIQEDFDWSDVENGFWLRKYSDK